MIKLPKLNVLDSSRSMVNVFRGYDHRLVTSEGSFYDENNLTSDNYPVLSTRSDYGIHAIAPDKVEAMLEKDVLCYAADQTLYVGDKTYPLSDDGTIKQLVSMGAYVIALGTSGKLYYANTIGSDYGQVLCYSNSFSNLDAETGTPTSVEMYVSDDTGKQALPSNPTQDPQIGDLIFETSGPSVVLKRYDGAAWVTVTKHITFRKEGVGKGFMPGDIVNVRGANLQGGSNESYETKVAKAEGDILVVEFFSGLSFFSPIGVTNLLEIKKPLGALDFICVSNNRLWACRRGVQKGYMNKYSGTNMVNEIYASKLGDFKTFDYYPGTAMDSYTVSIGTDGDFTGAITYQGNPIFFKEGVIHRITGTIPANYQIQTTECQGVKEGSYRSLANVDNILFYHAPSGIYAYDGSLPQSISTVFGNMRFKNAVAGAYLRKYYVNMCNANGVYATYVYDIDNGVWHKQDENSRVDAFAPSENALYYSSVNTIYTMFGTGGYDAKPLTWYAETGLIGTDSPDKKYLSRMTFRLSLTDKSRMIVFIEYDSCGEWTHAATIAGIDLSSFSFTVKIERCDHFRIRLEGVGSCKLFSITKTMERGGEE